MSRRELVLGGGHVERGGFEVRDRKGLHVNVEVVAYLHDSIVSASNRSI